MIASMADLLKVHALVRKHCPHMPVRRACRVQGPYAGSLYHVTINYHRLKYHDYVHATDKWHAAAQAWRACLVKYVPDFAGDTA